MLLFCLLFHLLRPTLSFSPGQIRFGKVLTRVARVKSLSDPHFQDLIRDTQKVHNTAQTLGESNKITPVKDLNTLQTEYQIGGNCNKRVGSSSFFDKLAVNANAKLELSTRKIMHVKMEFYTRYTNPLVPHYNKFLSNLIAALFSQSNDPMYAYDALQAFGICTQYYSVMKGYAHQDQVEPIFETMMHALDMHPTAIKEDAKLLVQQVDLTKSLSDEDFLRSADSKVGRIFGSVRGNRLFHYTDAWGVGLARLMELRQRNPPIPVDFKAWCELLVNVPAERLSASWSAFCTAQSIVRNADLMQKELLVREREQLASKLAKAKDKNNKIDNLQRSINVAAGEGKEHVHASIIRSCESAR